MKTAEQTAEKLAEYVCVRIDKTTHGEAFNEILNALHEYGAAVRNRAAGVCRDLAEGPLEKECDTWPESQPNAVAGAEDCADAIERMELP